MASCNQLGQLQWKLLSQARSNLNPRLSQHVRVIANLHWKPMPFLSILTLVVETMDIWASLWQIHSTMPLSPATLLLLPYDVRPAVHPGVFTLPNGFTHVLQSDAFQHIHDKIYVSSTRLPLPPSPPPPRPCLVSISHVLNCMSGCTSWY